MGTISTAPVRKSHFPPRRHLATALAGLVLAGAFSWNAQAAEDDFPLQLMPAKTQFDHGRYMGAIQMVEEIVVMGLLETEEEAAEAWRIHGLSNLYTGKKEAAVASFRRLLRHSPDYVLDELVVSPEAVRILEEIRQEMKPDLDAIRKRRLQDGRASLAFHPDSESPDESSQTPSTAISTDGASPSAEGAPTAVAAGNAAAGSGKAASSDKAENKADASPRPEPSLAAMDHGSQTFTLVIQESRDVPFVVNFMPFGTAQFAQGRNGAGTAFAITQGLATAGAIVSWAAILSDLDGGAHVRDGRAGAIKGWRIANWATMGAGLALYVGGVIDAVAHHQDGRQMKYVVTPSASQGGAAPMNAVPFVAPVEGGAAAGLSGNF